MAENPAVDVFDREKKSTLPLPSPLVASFPTDTPATTDVEGGECEVWVCVECGGKKR